MKPYLCNYCGETDSKYFYTYKKTKCVPCVLGKIKEEYKPHLKKRKVKPYLCNTCGETDPDKFSHGSKSKCKKCMAIWSSNNYYPTSTPICFNENGRKIKPLLCKDCGETDPDKFINALKTRCKACHYKHLRTKYVPKPIQIKPHHCNYCGETNPNKFNTGSKTKCRSCANIIYANSDRELSCEDVLEIKRIRAIPKPPKPVKEPKQYLPHHCLTCGETDPDKFRDTIKTRCWNCQKEIERIEYRKKRGDYLNKDFKLGKIALKTIQQRNNIIKSLIKKAENYRPKKHKRPNININMAVSQAKFEKNRIKRRSVGIKSLIKKAENYKTKLNRGGSNAHSQEQFINKVRLRHGDRYSFKNTVYKTSRIPIILTCTKHQYDFEIKPSVILGNKKKGKARPKMVGSCPLCLNEYYGKKLIKFEKPKHGRVTKFKYIEGKKYYPCEIHGNVEVGKRRNYNQGCPTCNIENYQKKLKKAKDLNQVLIAYKSVDRKEKVLTAKQQKALERSRVPKVNYVKAKTRVRKNNIRSQSEYNAWIKRTSQHDLPVCPDRTYKNNGWVNFWEFFGTSRYEGLSHGEQRIHDYLKRKGIEFETEKKFKGCRNINLLRFDFYLPEYNTCIEFDGGQHFRPAHFSSDPDKNMEKFLQLQKNDSIKNEYCKKENIILLRFDDYDLTNNVIEWSLDNELTRTAALIAIGEY